VIYGVILVIRVCLNFVMIATPLLVSHFDSGRCFCVYDNNWFAKMRFWLNS